MLVWLNQWQYFVYSIDRRSGTNEREAGGVKKTEYSEKRAAQVSRLLSRRSPYLHFPRSPKLRTVWRRPILPFCVYQITVSVTVSLLFLYAVIPYYIMISLPIIWCFALPWAVGRVYIISSTTYSKVYSKEQAFCISISGQLCRTNKKRV